MAFGAKIKLTVDEKSSSKLHSEIQKFANKEAIVLKNFTVEVKDGQKKALIKDLQTNLLNDNALILKIKKIDATDAVNDLRDQLTKMLSGLKITGLKEFLSEKNIDTAVKKIDEVKKSSAQWTAQLKSVNDISSKLSSVYKSALSGKKSINDDRLDNFTKEYTAYQEMVEQFRQTKVPMSAADLEVLQQEGIALQRKIELIQQEQSETDKATKNWEKQSDVLGKFSEKLEDSVQNMQSNTDSSNTNNADDEKAKEEKALVESVVKDYENWKAKVEELRQSKTSATAESISALQKEGEAIRAQVALIENKRKEDKKATEEADARAKKETTWAQQQITLRKQVQSYINSNSKAYQKYGDELDGIMEQLGEHSKLTDTQLKQVRMRFTEIQRSAVLSGDTGSTFFDTLKKGWEKFGGWSLVTKSFMTAVRMIKSAISSAKEIDAAMTELKKVTDLTEASYAKFIDTATAVSKTIGTSLADTINATADFARLGYSVSDATELAKAAIVYQNVGDGIDNISVASESLISTIKAFGMEASDVMSIVDRFNEVGNKFAISSDGIGTALQKSASSLAAANNTLEESIALITGMNAVVQNPEVVGTALKTVSMYLRAAKTEAEEFGESTDGMAESVSKLRSKILELTGKKVDIMIDNSTFKSTYQIMKELSEVWDKLADIDRANILELIGGKRNATAITSLLTNFEDAENAMQTASNATGSAMAENEKYLDSIAGRFDQLKASFEAFSVSLVNNDLIKIIVSLGTEVLNLVTSLQKIKILLPAIAGTVAYIVSMRKANQAAESAARAQSILNELVDTKTATDELVASYWGLTKARRQDILTVLQARVANGNLKQAEYEAITSKLGLTAATEGAKIATDGLNYSLKALLLSNPIGWIITAVSLLPTAWAIITSVSKSFIKTSEELIEDSNKLNEAFQTESQTVSDNIKTIKGLKDEYEELSRGVDETGKNVSLSSDEYTRYKDIVSQIVEISPELIKGYDEENGYLVEKNNLIEESIRLQQEEYAAELKKMTAVDKAKVSIGGYIEEYKKLQKEKSNTQKYGEDLSNSLSGLFKNGLDSQAETEDRIRKIYSIINPTNSDDIEYKIGKWLERVSSQSRTNDERVFSNYIIQQFLSTYKEDIYKNLDQIVAQFDYEDFGFNNITDYKAAVNTFRDYAQSAFDAGDIEAQIQKFRDSLGLIFKATDEYYEMKSDIQGLVSDYINTFSYEDVMTNGRFDDSKYSVIKYNIEQYVSELYKHQPEIEKAFEVKLKFASGDINAGEYKKQIDVLRKTLKSIGVDDNTIANIDLKLNTESFEEQLSHATVLLTKEQKQLANTLSEEDLKYAYEIKAAPNSLTFDELKDQIFKLKVEDASFENIFDFSEMTEGLSKTESAIKNLTSAMAELNQGTALTVEQLAKLAFEYPKLLEQSNLFTDGSIEGQKKMLNAIMEVTEKEYDAKIDTKIAELTASQKVVEAQLELEKQKAAIIVEIEALSAKGRIENASDIVDKIAEFNDLQGQNYVTTENGILKVNQAALENMLEQGADFGKDSAENIWTPYAKMIESAHTKGYEAAGKASDAYNEALAEKLGKTVENTLKPYSQDYANAMSGKLTSENSEIGKRSRGFGYEDELAEKLRLHNPNRISKEFILSETEDTIKVEFYNGLANKKLSDSETTLDEWVDAQQKNSAARIKALEEMQQQIQNTIANLESLKGLNLVDIYSSNKGGKAKDAYTAEIDKYYKAVKALEAAQQAREIIDEKIKNSDKPLDRISYEFELVDAYKAEAEAERNLMTQKRLGIAQNIEALRRLGFVVDYNAEKNELLIQNMEHLNELTATSTGKHETLTEATNDLIKETEKFIEKTEKLNDDNITSEKNIRNIAATIDNTTDEIVKNIEEIVNTSKDALDGINGAYETLSNALDELSANGFISVDTFKSVLDLGTKYLNYLYDENGVLKLNEDAINNVISAKVRDYAITKALALVNTARQYKDDSEKLNELADASAGAAATTWDFVYAKLAELSLGDKINAALKTQIDRLKELSENTVNGIGKSVGDYEDSLKSIIDYTKELIRKEKELEKEALEKQVDEYRKIVDLKKESLDATKDEAEYQQTVSEKVSNLAELQSKIDRLGLDDSREARLKKAELEKELAEAQKELVDYQQERSIEKQKEALDKEVEDFEEATSRKTEAIDKELSSEEKLYRLAIRRISTQWGTLHDDLISWNEEYGSSLNSEIESAWEKALEAAKKYGDFVSAMKATGISGADYSSSSSGRKTSSKDISSVSDKLNAMKTNSKLWHTEPAYRDALVKDNERLAEEIRKETGAKVVKDAASGKWYINGVELEKYHTGGIVGDSYSMKQNEVVAVLEKGETVLTTGQSSALYKVIDFADYLSKRLGSTIDTNGLFKSPFGSSSLQKITSSPEVKGVQSKTEYNFAPNIDVSVNIDGDSGDVSKYEKLSRSIADTTLDRLKDAFAKRGISPIKNPSLG